MNSEQILIEALRSIMLCKTNESTKMGLIAYEAIQKYNSIIIKENWPKNEYGHFKCTKEKPIPLELKREGRWEHDDVNETDYDGE